MSATKEAYMKDLENKAHRIYEYWLRESNKHDATYENVAEAFGVMASDVKAIVRDYEAKWHRN